MDKKLIPNSTQIPNILLDEVIPKISEADGKCLLYICRRTYGFHKERDRISLSQFTDGIKNRDGEILDMGTGLSRPAVVGALKNLIGSKIIKMIPTGAGNYYEINLEFNDFGEVVKEVNQLRKLTKIGKESKPKQGKLLNPQKKGNKGNKDIMSAEPTGWNFNSKLDEMRKDPRRHIQIIALYWTAKNIRFENDGQYQPNLKRECRPAMALIGYKDEDIKETIKTIENTEYMRKWTLETVTKFINEVVLNKKETGPKIISWEEVTRPDGHKAMRPIYAQAVNQ